MRRKRDVPRQKQRFGRWWRMVGYNGPPYCQRCSEVFRDHLMRQTPNSAKCSRACPCDDCARVLQCFSTGPGGIQDLWDRIDARNSKNKEKQASKKRSAPSSGSNARDMPPTVPLPDTQPPPDVAAAPAAMPGAPPWPGTSAIAAPWQPRVAADAEAGSFLSSDPSKLRELQGAEQEQALLAGKKTLPPLYHLATKWLANTNNLLVLCNPSGEFQINFAGKRACYWHGKTSPGAVVASLVLLSVVATAGMYSGTAGPDPTAGGANDLSEPSNSDPLTDITPCATEHSPVVDGWAKISVTGTTEFIPAARQDASTWVTDDETIWVYGGLGDSPPLTDVKGIFKRDPNSFDAKNSDGGGFRKDMWKGEYTTTPDDGEDSEGRTLQFTRVDHNWITAANLSWP